MTLAKVIIQIGKKVITATYIRSVKWFEVVDNYYQHSILLLLTKHRKSR